MGIARRVKSVVALAAIAVGVSVAAGTGATIAGADPNTEPPGKTKDHGPATEDRAMLEGCCYQLVDGPFVNLPPGGFARAEAVCPLNQGIGQAVLGGGGVNGSTRGEVVLTDSFPSNSNTWQVYMKNNSPDSAFGFRAYAVCGTYFPINGQPG